MKESVRRSHLLYSGGVGALTILKSGTAVVCGGLDYWFRDAQGNPVPESAVSSRVSDWRLEARLGVEELRAPPAAEEGLGERGAKVAVPFLLFPLWHVCPRCRRLKKVAALATLSHYCEECAVAQGKERGPRLVQVPFVAACPSGHLDEFPWETWIKDCRCEGGGGPYRLTQAGGTGLGNFVLRCEGCGRSRSLQGALSSDRPLGPCRGRRPWFVDGDQPGCEEGLVGVLRNASNVYYGQLFSSVHLPRRLSNVPAPLRDLLSTTAVAAQVASLGAAGVTSTQAVAVLKGQYASVREYPDDVVLAALEESSRAEADTSCEAVDEAEFRLMEYQALSTEVEDPRLRVRVMPIDRYSFGAGVPVTGVSLVEDLTVTTALVGFSRLLPSLPDPEHGRRLLWKRPPGGRGGWLPAVQVRGEGVFVRFDEAVLREWEQRPEVKARFEALFLRAVGSRRRSWPEGALSPRYVLLHTFSHLLMRRMVFAAGYTATSLAERVYARPGEDDGHGAQAGVLIYTASGDSEGSLGGLVRLGRPGVLETLVLEALDEASWCSNDPVCMELGGAGGQGPEGLNLAACHSCAHAPETACENGNVLLDRASVVGSLEEPRLGLLVRR